jgi:hypothetical protein
MEGMFEDFVGIDIGRHKRGLDRRRSDKIKGGMLEVRGNRERLRGKGRNKRTRRTRREIERSHPQELQEIGLEG